MQVTVPNPYGELTEKELSRFESRLGAKLPESYRSFLLQYNGATWVDKRFLVSPSEGSSNIHHVHGIHQGPEYRQLESAIERFRGRMPDWCIPIADDEAGNQVCISVREDDKGRIYFWDHETNELVLVSATFEQFLESLSPEPVSADEMDEIIEKDDAKAVEELVSTGYDIEALDENGRSLVERAAIKGKPNIIIFLSQKGVSWRNSLALAQKNAKYFPEHRSIVDLIQKLQRE